MKLLYPNYFIMFVNLKSQISGRCTVRRQRTEMPCYSTQVCGCLRL